MWLAGPRAKSVRVPSTGARPEVTDELQQSNASVPRMAGQRKAPIIVDRFILASEREQKARTPKEAVKRECGNCIKREARP